MKWYIYIKYKKSFHPKTYKVYFDIKYKKMYIYSSDGGITVWIFNEDEKSTDSFD